jgi:hypothetical protein
MKRFFAAAASAVVLLGAWIAPAGADSYLFERSYYSHAPAAPVVIGHRAPLGGPAFTRPQGMAASTGYRWQRSQIRVGGQVVDQLNTWDTWIQFQGKY